MRLKIGAATAPPLVPLACGASIITMIATAGFRDGAKPTNDTLFSDAEYRPPISFEAVPVLPATV